MSLAFTILFLGLTPALAADAAPVQEILIEKDSGANPWTRLEVKSGAGRFHFAIVADRAGGNRAGVLAEAVRKLNLVQPAFVLSLGDLQEGYTSDPATFLSQGQEGTRREFRLNVGAIDRDPNEWALRIRWRPQWGTANDFAGSGTFRRQQSAGSVAGSSGTPAGDFQGR